jgi:hypothetical protein
VQLAGLDVLQHRIDVLKRKINLVARQIVDGWRAALLGHMQAFGAALPPEHLSRQMVGRSIAGARKTDLARLALSAAMTCATVRAFCAGLATSTFGA